VSDATIPFRQKVIPQTVSRILITGAGGFVGRHALAAFAGKLGAGDALAGIGRAMPAEQSDRVERRSIDLLDGPALTAFVAAFRPTHILHLAALSSVQQSAGSAGETWRSNVLGLLNLAEAVAQGAPGASVVFASSGEVYGRAFLSGEPVDEAARPQPANVYARTKLAGEDLLGDVLPAAGVKLIVLRPFNHIGPGQDERFVVPSFAGQVARIEAGLVPPVVEVGDLSARRDFLDVADVVAAYSAVIERSDELADRSVFNIASGIARPISDILATFRAKARLPFEIRVARDRLRPSEIPTASGDASALVAAVGWRPQVPWADSLGAILDDARSRLSTMTDKE